MLKCGENYDRSIFSRFFEQINELLLLDDKSASSVENDHLNFIRHELFLYSIAIALKKEDYVLVDELINGDYFLQDRYRKNNSPSKFDAFRSHSDSIERYVNQVNNQRYASAVAHLFIQRLSTEVSKEEFAQADLLCYYSSKMRNGRWFPITYIYQSEYNGYFPFFTKMVSKRHLDKVMYIFGTTDISGLSTKFNELDKIEDQGFSGFFSRVHKISNWVKTEEIGTGR